MDTHPHAQPSAKYITHAELADTFGVKRPTVTEWKKQGMPCLNLNPKSQRGMYRFNVAEVAAWLEARADGKGVEA